MAFTLPELPYSFDALEPHIDAKTMEIHHDKHHGTYVTNVNKALEGKDLGNSSIEDILRNIDSLPEDIRTAVRNNGGGHANHSLFWQILSKKGGGEPKDELGKAIDRDLGGFAKLTEDLTKAALGRFGSGWAWLSLDKSGKLIVESTPNQDSPLMHGNVPVMGIDVWEHAYYLKYQNRRADYLKAIFNVFDWSVINDHYRKISKS